MDVVLWIIQIVLSIKLASTALTHALQQSRPIMQEAIRRAGGASARNLRLVSVCMVVGALGLVLPGIVGASGHITAVIAAAVAILMLTAIGLHIRCRERPLIIADTILFLLATFVAYGRWALVP